RYSSSRQAGIKEEPETDTGKDARPQIDRQFQRQILVNAAPDENLAQKDGKNDSHDRTDGPGGDKRAEHRNHRRVRMGLASRKDKRQYGCGELSGRNGPFLSRR